MIALPQAAAASPPRPRVLGGRSPTVGAWLFLVAGFVFAMVVVGGATRLTGSGLSITEWKPFSGALPPLTNSAWAEAFGKYRASSQYRLVNRGISLHDFQILFWWEWAHRLLGRSVGLLFAAPFLGFMAFRKIPDRLVGRCVVLFAFGGLQGLVGWWMVESGLEGRASVAPERLAAHLGLALILFCALVWTGLEAWAGQARAGYRRQDGWSRIAGVFAFGVYLQCLMGALVAGNAAGMVDTDWPLMNGHFFPADYWRDTLWSTFAHSRAAVQFNHRAFAYGLVALALTLTAVAYQSRSTPKGFKILILVCTSLLMLQACLGIATLLLGDPLWLALVHQGNATVLLALAVGLTWKARRA